MTQLASSERPPELQTARLLLRGWRDADRPAFAAINADPRVMAHFPAILSRVESDRLIDAFTAGFAFRGFGRWAIERRSDGALLGFAGLSVPSFEAPFMPAVEIAWRLAAAAWGQGYAVEAARAALAFGFDVAGLKAAVAFTVPANLRSLALMQRLGMQEVEGGAFDHPALPPGHPLRRHLLYRIIPDQGAGKSGGS